MRRRAKKREKLAKPVSPKKLYRAGGIIPVFGDTE